MTSAIFSFGLAVFIFAFMTHAAGQARQARFNVDVLGRIFAAHHQKKGFYPASKEQLPKFFVISALDRLYLDHKCFKEAEFKGYQYAMEALGPDQFIISASPVGPWPGKPEFGITEKGILKSNTSRADIDSDPLEEIESWKTIERTARVKVQ
ncbi:MAG: hypothetical protein WC676_08540 [Candidatus Omnitrophota bacterium]